MIFWRGNGVIVLLYFIAIIFLSAMIGGGLLHFQDDTIQMYILELCIAFAFSYPIWKYGKKINSVTHELIDKKTGQEVIHKESHSFFLIPVEYWAVIIPVGLIIIFVIASFNHN